MQKSSLFGKDKTVEQRLQKIERYMLWSSIVGTARLIIILIPIILAVIYVPSFVRKYLPAIDLLQNYVVRPSK